MITCLKSKVLITVYLIVISSILQKYHSQVCISMISHILNSFVYRIIIHANIFHNTSLKASQTHNETHDTKSHILTHMISKLINNANNIKTQNNMLQSSFAIFAAHVGFVSSKCFLIFLFIILVIIFDITTKSTKTKIPAQIFNQYEINWLSVMLLVHEVSWVVSTFVSSIFLFYLVNKINDSQNHKLYINLIITNNFFFSKKHNIT